MTVKCEKKGRQESQDVFQGTFYTAVTSAKVKTRLLCCSMHGLHQPTPPHGELPRFSVEAFGAVHRALQRQYSEARPKTPCDFGSFEDACLHDQELQFR